MTESDNLSETPHVASGSGGDHMGQVEMRESFDALKEASDTLNLNVEALNHTLQAVNALQVEQARQKKVQEKAEQDLEAARIESEQRDARTRRTFTFVGLSLAVLLPLVSLLVYAALLNHVNDLLDQQQASRYSNCIARNQATTENIRRELELAKIGDDPKVMAIHRQSAEELAKGQVDCSTYKK
jgi:hypothetical protein